MAKVQGALFSVDASGTYAGKLTFAKWKGIQYVRNRVDPANPMFEGQVFARNKIRMTGAIQHWMNLTAEKGDGRSLTDKQLLTADAPSGTAWNSHITKACIGSGGARYDDATTAYAALSGGEKTAWNTAAAGLTPPLLDVAQFEEFNAVGTPMAAGEVFFRSQYGLFVLGIGDEPTGTPFVYA